MAENSPINYFLSPIEEVYSYSGIEGIDRIFLINLKRQTVKRIQSEKIAERYNFFLNRFEAIEGAKIPMSVQRILTEPKYKPLSSGAFGLFLSFLSIIQHAHQKNYERIWILEDDFEVLSDPRALVPILNKLDRLDPTWDIFFTDLGKKYPLGNKGVSDSNRHIPRYMQNQAMNLRNCDDWLKDLEIYSSSYQVDQEIFRQYLRFGNHSLILSKGGIERICNFYNDHLLADVTDNDLYFIPEIKIYRPNRDIVSVSIDWVESDTCK
jgi:hypothetical protein